MRSWRDAIEPERGEPAVMSTMITDACILCGICEPECPNGAIREGRDAFEIDPNLCTECVGFHDSEQCAAVCPVDCCVSDPLRVESEEKLFRRALEIHPDLGPELRLSPATSRFRRDST
jgi:ferredoxin